MGTPGDRHDGRGQPAAREAEEIGEPAGEPRLLWTDEKKRDQEESNPREPKGERHTPSVVVKLHGELESEEAGADHECAAPGAHSTFPKGCTRKLSVHRTLASAHIAMTTAAP
jgi:hypothetical protein